MPLLFAGSDRWSFYLTENRWFEFSSVFPRLVAFSRPYYLTIAERGKRWIHDIPKVINAKRNASSLVKNWNLGGRFYFLQ